MARKTRIIVSGLEVFAYHGCTPREQEDGQRFLIDIELEYDAARAVEADDLAEAVDYDALAEAVHELAARERYDLIEALATRIAEFVMDTTSALRVLVRVHKPQAPMLREVEDVAVEVVLEGYGR